MLCLIAVPALCFGLFLADAVYSGFADSPLAFRFEEAPKIQKKSAPTSISLSCNDDSFYVGDVYCLNASVYGNDYYEEGVRWAIQGDSVSYFVSANRLYFSSYDVGEATIKAFSVMDDSINGAFTLNFKKENGYHAPKSYTITTFFFSSGADILTYSTSCAYYYDRSVKVNLLAQNPDHFSASIAPSFKLVSDCYSTMDEFGNILLDPRDLAKTIQGNASIVLESGKTYTADFFFTVLYPRGYGTRTVELYVSSFLLNAVPFAAFACCMALLLQRFNHITTKMEIILLALSCVTLVGLNLISCLLSGGTNLSLVISTSAISSLLGALFPYLRGSIRRRAHHE